MSHSNMFHTKLFFTMLHHHSNCMIFFWTLSFMDLNIHVKHLSLVLLTGDLNKYFKDYPVLALVVLVRLY